MICKERIFSFLKENYKKEFSAPMIANELTSFSESSIRRLLLDLYNEGHVIRRREPLMYRGFFYYWRIAKKHRPQNHLPDPKNFTSKEINANPDFWEVFN